MRTPWLFTAVLVCAGAVTAASVGEGAAVDLPVNRWVVAADEKDGGCAAGMIYAPDLKGMLLFGKRVRSNWKGTPVSKRYWVEVFRTAERTWQEWVPEAGRVEAGLGRGTAYTEWVVKDGYGMPAIPTPNRAYWAAHQRCYMPPQKAALYFHGGVTFTYDPTARAFENKKIPFGKAPPDVMLGSMAWDPVNGQAILFGGGYIQAYKARRGQKRPADAWKPKDWDRRGTWAYDPRANTWQKLQTASPEVAAAYNALTDLRERDLRSLWGACRGIAFEYGDMVFGGTPAALAGRVEALAGRLKDFAETEGRKGLGDYEKSQFSGAAGLIADAVLPNLKDAAAALKADDGWKAFQALEAARKKLIEAEERLAPAPPPRHYARLVTDPVNKVMVLWGGDGEDRFLADTWILDLQTHRWERCRPEVHPPTNGYAMVTMDYDARNKVVVLVRQSGDVWTFDAAERAWRPLAIPKEHFGLTTSRGPRGTQFATMEYDPAADAHVFVHLKWENYKAPPRKTLLLRLDPATAGTAKAKPAPEEAWRPQYGSGCSGPANKFGLAWKHLPKTQAEYRAKVAAHEAKLKAMPANTWTHLPAPYSGIGRAYGSFCYDWDRDEILMWGGGHSAYMGNEWSQYDARSNLWMESWNPEFPAHPFGSPDGSGWGPSFKYEAASSHGYHYYVYFGGIRKALLGASMYDPDRMRHAGALKKVGQGSLGTKVEMNGHPGQFSVAPLYHAGGPFGVWRADAETKTVRMIPRSRPPFSGSDRVKWVFDTKRERILCYGTRREVKVKGKKRGLLNGFWAFALKSGAWEQIRPDIEPAGTEPPQITHWNYCYSSKHDCLVVMPRDRETWIYDCGKNLFRKIAGARWPNRSTPCGVVYSAKQDLFYAMPDNGYSPQQVYALRLEP